MGSRKETERPRTIDRSVVDKFIVNCINIRENNIQ